MSKRQLKRDLAKALAMHIGFESLDDKKTIIKKENLVRGIPFLKKKQHLISQTFKGSVLRRLKRPIKDSFDVIKLFRMILSNNDIQKGIYSIKQNRFKKGKHITIYSYRLLH